MFVALLCQVFRFPLTNGLDGWIIMNDHADILGTNKPLQTAERARHVNMRLVYKIV